MDWQRHNRLTDRETVSSASYYLFKEIVSRQNIYFQYR